MRLNDLDKKKNQLILFYYTRLDPFWFEEIKLSFFTSAPTKKPRTPECSLFDFCSKHFLILSKTGEIHIKSIYQKSCSRKSNKALSRKSEYPFDRNSIKTSSRGGKDKRDYLCKRARGNFNYAAFLFFGRALCVNDRVNDAVLELSSSEYRGSLYRFVCRRLPFFDGQKLLARISVYYYYRDLNSFLFLPRCVPPEMPPIVADQKRGIPDILETICIG